MKKWSAVQWMQQQPQMKRKDPLMRMTPFHLPSSIAYCNCCNCWPVLSMYRYWISHVWTLLYNILTVWKEEEPDECKLASAAFFLVPLLKDDKRVDPFRRWVGLLHHNSLYEWRQTDRQRRRTFLFCFFCSSATKGGEEDKNPMKGTISQLIM